MEKDSNLRRHRQQIYSLSPLATRESTHNIIHKNQISMPNVKPMIGLEPITC